MIIGLNHYNLRASPDVIEELKIFYENIVGLRVGIRPSFSNGGYWLYAGKKDVLHLSWSKNGNVNQINTISTFDHMAFTATDIGEVKKKLKLNKINFSERELPEIGTKQIFFKDPAGNGIELIFPLEDK